MFSKKIKSLLLSIITFQLTIGTSLAYAEPAISSQARTTEMINDFLKNANPSDLPFVDYMESFTHNKIQPIKRFDLSDYNGKQIYVGYGIFDEDQKYCKYVEQPGLDPEHNSADKLSTYFNKIGTFNQHQYAISIDKMTFDECQDKVDHFGGYIAVPTSLAENGYLSGKYSGDKWLGIEKEDCSEETPYINQENKDQEYFKWSIHEDPNKCESSKLHLKQNKYGTWERQKGTESNYCVIETDSEDINRPVKICAPWWRVERDYKKDQPVSYGGINVYRINQADIPQQSVVCTHMNIEDLEESEDKPHRQVTCTTYYDATRAPECLHDPIQPQCFIDECSGYIRNACVHEQEITPYKDYTKTKAVVDGELQWIKGKVNIRTQVFDCPPSPPSLKNSCLETSTVVIYPKECPGSQCQELKECVYNADTKEKKNECYSHYKCQKIYGSPDLPVYDSEGKLTNLKGYCTDEDGNNIEPALLFDINVQNKKERKCLEYEEYNLTKHVSQNCTLDRPYNDYTVEVSLTGEDIYEDNPMCIRLNNVFDSRPMQELTLNYISNGFAKTIIKKAFINGENNTNVEDGSDDYILNPDEVAAQENTGSEDISLESNESAVDCSDFPESWFNSTYNKLIAGNLISITSSSFDGSFSDTSVMKMKFKNIETKGDCINLKDTYGDSYDYNMGTQICNVYFSKAGADPLFKYIAGTETAYFHSETEITKDECKRYADCLGGVYNKSDFSSGNAVCKVTAGDDTEEEGSASLEESPEPKECKPPTSEGSLETQFNGNEDIFAIQETVEGKFGYYSNHTTWNYKNNVVTYEDKELFPIKPISTIQDPLIYEGIFKQISILTKKPNILAGAVGGAVAGGAAYYAGLAATGIGLVVIAVFAIVAAIFGPRKKYNEQYNYWIIYKLVPVSRYIDNVYGYDYRIMDKNDDGTRKVYSGNMYKLIYMELGKDPRKVGYKENFTGTLKPADFKVLIKNWFKQKKQLLMCSGWEASSVPHIAMETSVVVRYPKCKWYKPHCNKRNSDVQNSTVNPFYKTMSNYYKGAVNTVSIVVPYIGDYEVKAYDKYDNLLGDMIVHESEFIGASAGKASYAHIMFGLNMDIAEGVNNGNTAGACRYDLMTEWGGGVSGIYYENDNTGLYSGCDKSNDSYVQDHSAVRLTVQSLGEDKAFQIVLDKPMPWANRTFLVTLGEKEIRKYRCYDDFGECESEDYVTEGDE